MKISNIKYIIFFIVIFFFCIVSVDAKFKSTKELEGTIVIPENNYCLNNNFDTLSECMLVMDSYSNSVSNAKSNIEAKGTPDFSNIAPTIYYVEGELVNNNSTLSTSNYYYGSDSITFDSTTGLYSLGHPWTRITADDEHTSYVGKWTCAATTGNGCNQVYLIEEDSNDGSSYSITSSKIKTNSILKTLDSDSGLFYSNDDLGKSYYYRGDVKNNFVLFANKYWRIVRRNGDGSVRLMYYSDGNATGTYAFKSGINKHFWDPTYVGYMYNDNFSSTMIESSQATFNNFNENSTYYFGNSYSYDSSTKKFSLDGSVATGEIRSGVWKNDYQSLLNDGYIYSCFSADGETGTCSVLIKVVGYNDSNEIDVNYLSYSSTSYSDAITNTNNSNILTKLNEWYSTNLSSQYDDDNNLITDYISDGIFCNDRSLGTEEGNGNGYSLSPSTYYSGYRRIYDSTPIFTCNNNNDAFSVNNSIGNGTLTNPIGLLTADEVIFAGGTKNKPNSLFFMNYGDDDYTWTLTPSLYSSWSRIGSLFTLNKKGYLTDWYNITVYASIRPVINIKDSVKIAGGDGTINNPYTLTINNS